MIEIGHSAVVIGPLQQTTDQCPISITNRELSEDEINDRLEHYDIPTDLPLVVQISRFDRWKDPEGVVQAYTLARKEVDCTLVLLGNVATDDPEGEQVYQSLLACREEHIIILSCEDTAFQRIVQLIKDESLRKQIGERARETVRQRFLMTRLLEQDLDLFHSLV